MLPTHWLLPSAIIRCFLGLVLSCQLLTMLNLTGQSVCIHSMLNIVKGLNSTNGNRFKMCLTVAIPHVQPLIEWLISCHKVRNFYILVQYIVCCFFLFWLFACSFAWVFSCIYLLVCLVILSVCYLCVAVAGFSACCMLLGSRISTL